MSASKETRGTKIVRVRHERGKSGFFFASTTDIDGLVVSASTPEELEVLIPEAITQLYKACGVEVIVTKVEDGPDEWAAMPAELAEQKLAELRA